MQYAAFGDALQKERLKQRTRCLDACALKLQCLQNIRNNCIKQYFKKINAKIYFDLGKKPKKISPYVVSYTRLKGVSNKTVINIK